MAGDVASAAGGSTPWGAIAQAGVGLAQTIGGWIQQRKATKALEKLKSPTYNQNQSILDYYNQALQRYNVSPTESALYKNQQKNIGRGLATGINAYQDRRSGQAGISSILRNANDASLNSEVAAENQRNQRFGQLGAATGMKAAEDAKAFQYNQLMPYQNKYNLLAQKASGGNAIANSGMSNIFGGINTANQMSMINKMYPSGK